MRDIKITNVNMSVYTLSDILENNEINVNPNNSVNYPWGEEKMSRLIESILLKIPLPILYFDVSNPNYWNSINGIQILYAIEDFIDGKLKLNNMEILTNLNGLDYSNLPNNYKRIFYDTQIITYQIEAQTPRELREFIFKRIRDMNAN